LSNEYSVEGIFVDGREAVNGGDVRGAQRQRGSGKLVEGLLPPEVRIAHVDLAFHALDHDFPEGHDTEKVSTFSDSSLCYRREVLRLKRGEESNVGVDKTSA
jgi:hypothetical protein